MATKSVATEIREALNQKLSRYYGISEGDADIQQIYNATVLSVRDILATRNKEFTDEVVKTEAKQVYYMCMEFLIGRSLKMNLFSI